MKYGSKLKPYFSLFLWITEQIFRLETSIIDPTIKLIVILLLIVEQMKIKCFIPKSSDLSNHGSNDLKLLKNGWIIILENTYTMLILMIYLTSN